MMWWSFNTSDVCCWTAHPNYSQVSTSWLVAADSAEEFGNKPPPLFSLLFILSWKLQVHWHQKSPTSHPPTCMCGTAYSVTGGGSKASLSLWAQNFTRVLCPDLYFLLWKQLQMLNPECEDWINCLKCVHCFLSLLLKTKKHKRPSKQNTFIWLTLHELLHRHEERYLLVSQ